MMHLLHLLRAPNPASTHPAYVTWGKALDGVTNELEINKNRHVSVYHTYAEVAGCKYAFVTTSKDIHLWLGTFSPAGHADLAVLLGLELELNNAGNQLLLYVEDKRVYLVTRTSTNEGRLEYTLSPAH